MIQPVYLLQLQYAFFKEVYSFQIECILLVI